MKTSIEAVADLVRNGAAFVHEPGGHVYTVGLMQQLEPERWFWWEAGVVDDFGGHHFRADRAEVIYDGAAVRFTLKGAFVGYLTAIDQAVDDPDGVEGARTVFREWRREFERSESLRAFIAARTTR
jgi:hypothetical protein